MQSSSSTATTTNNKVYKILSIDPIEVNKSLHSSRKTYQKSYKSNSLKQRNIIPTERLSKTYTSQINTDSDITQVIDLSFNDNEDSATTERISSSQKYCDKKGADILIQAMTHLDEKESNVNAPFSNPKVYSLDTEGNRGTSDEFVVHGSPGFVRVTSDSISVSKPMTKKMKFGKKLDNLYL